MLKINIKAIDICLTINTKLQKNYSFKCNSFAITNIQSFIHYRATIGYRTILMLDPMELTSSPGMYISTYKKLIKLSVIFYRKGTEPILCLVVVHPGSH